MPSSAILKRGGLSFEMDGNRHCKWQIGGVSFSKGQDIFTQTQSGNMVPLTSTFSPPSLSTLPVITYALLAKAFKVKDKAASCVCMWHTFMCSCVHVCVFFRCSSSENNYICLRQALLQPGACPLCSRVHTHVPSSVSPTLSLTAPEAHWLSWGGCLPCVATDVHCYMRVY